MTVQQSIPDVKPGDYVVYTKGKSKSLLRGLPYKVTSEYKVANVKGRGLTFSKFEKFNSSEYHTWYTQNRLQKFLFKLNKLKIIAGMVIRTILKKFL